MCCADVNEWMREMVARTHRHQATLLFTDLASHPGILLPRRRQEGKTGEVERHLHLRVFRPQHGPHHKMEPKEGTADMAARQAAEAEMAARHILKVRGRSSKGAPTIS